MWRLGISKFGKVLPTVIGKDKNGKDSSKTATIYENGKG